MTISDAMIMLSMLIYGGELAVLLAIFETAFTSFSLKRKGVEIRLKTAVANISIGAASVLVSTVVVRTFFGGSIVAVLENGETSTYIRLIALMTISLFLSNSIGISLVPKNLTVTRGNVGHDGQFYYRFALNPFTSKITEYGVTLDAPAYRQQRILYPAVTWALALGNANPAIHTT